MDRVSDPRVLKTACLAALVGHPSWMANVDPRFISLLIGVVPFVWGFITVGGNRRPLVAGRVPLRSRVSMIPFFGHPKVAVSWTPTRKGLRFRPRGNSGDPCSIQLNMGVFLRVPFGCLKGKPKGNYNFAGSLTPRHTHIAIALAMKRGNLGGFKRLDCSKDSLSAPDP